MELADWVFIQMEHEGAAVAIIDIIGLGQGCYDRLRQMGANVRPYDSRNKAQDTNRFANKRSESFCRLRDFFQEKNISIPNDEELIKQLATICVDPEKKNLVDAKRIIRQKIGRSPDEADSMSMAFSVNSDLFRESTKIKDFKRRPNWRTA